MRTQTTTQENSVQSAYKHVLSGGTVVMFSTRGTALYNAKCGHTYEYLQEHTPFAVDGATFRLI